LPEPLPSTSNLSTLSTHSASGPLVGGAERVTVGGTLGITLGVTEIVTDGVLEGLIDGNVVGTDDGAKLGVKLGVNEGNALGTDEGIAEGTVVLQIPHVDLQVWKIPVVPQAFCCFLQLVQSPSISNFNDESTQISQPSHVTGQCDFTPVYPHTSTLSAFLIWLHFFE